MPLDIRALSLGNPDSLPGDLGAVQRLARAATTHDGVAAFNEASALLLARMGTEQDERVLSGLVARVNLAVRDGVVVGVAVDAEGDGSAVDLAVDPAHRRGGVGTALVEAVRASAPAAAFWAHGDLPSSRAFAAATDLVLVRDLWRMSRPVTSSEQFDTVLPEGFSVRAFDGSDEQAQAWLDVNAAAFASHPEQGRMSMTDFRERTREPWFDPDGLILVWDERVTPAALAASHWTKHEPDADEGEVYVVAVAPQYQGQGLARPVTALGLEHLARVGVHRIDLYVEGDNEPAKATYERAGFLKSSQDTMYVHAQFA